MLARATEWVEGALIDNYDFDHVNLIKVDVEGMESHVVNGALKTIKRDKPIMFIENLAMDHDFDPGFRPRVAKMGYELHEIGMNVLCLPNDVAPQFKVSRTAAGVEVLFDKIERRL